MSSPLAQIALDSLQAASQNRSDARFVLERNVVQPDSWLIRCCWQALADGGAGREALAVARLAEARQPLAPMQALHRVAKEAVHQPGLRTFISEELNAHKQRLLAEDNDMFGSSRTERLLLAAASAALIGDEPATITYLETLDQIPKGWDRVFIHPEQRAILAETVVRTGLYPLTDHLITGAVRNFSDSGAQLLQQVAEFIGKNDASANAALDVRYCDPQRATALLHRCAITLHNAALVSLFSRRIAATVLAQAGMVAEMMEQIDTIATIQDAHRETGFTHRAGTPIRTSIGVHDDDTVLLRQVIRPRANADIDFQAYTLRNALSVLPLTGLTEAQRQSLAYRLASLGVQSDGWTAAAIVPTLIRLGAVQYAVDVVSRIEEGDPTRSEGIIALAGALLEAGQGESAQQQIDKALAWARSLPERTPERAMRWGLAEVYLHHGQPGHALHLLTPRGQPSFWVRLRHLFRDTMSDAELRTERIRFQALLKQEGNTPDYPLSPRLRTLLGELRTWAPRLLEGEALINFMRDGLLAPLIYAQRWEEAWQLLPVMCDTLVTIRGNRHASRVAEIVILVRNGIQTHIVHQDADEANRARAALEEFVLMLWEANAARGIWQAVYGIEGTLPLLLLLEGPDALVHIAQAAAEQGATWDQ